jgi:hypothetical protein
LEKAGDALVVRFFFDDEEFGLAVGVADFEELDVVGDSDCVDVLLVGASIFPESCQSFTISNSKINGKDE